jgi:hypothetical protein
MLVGLFVAVVSVVAVVAFVAVAVCGVILRLGLSSTIYEYLIE